MSPSTEKALAAAVTKLMAPIARDACEYTQKHKITVLYHYRLSETSDVFQVMEKTLCCHS